MSTTRKDPALDKKHKAILKKMMQLPENKTCADCKGHSPRWASTNLGVFLCIACSGIHRKIGTHISKIRSTTLDVWTAEQIAHFQALGNLKAAEIYESHLPPGFQRPPSSDAFTMENFIRNKYERRTFSSSEHANAAAAGTLSSSARLAHAYVASNPRDSSLGSRPEQYASARMGGYDNLSQPGATFNSHSYSSQFRSNSQHDGFRSNAQRPSNSWSSSSASRKSPVIRSLLEMGFPEDLAEDAATRHGSNLQKAADWVLKQKSVRLYSAPAPRPAPRPAPPENLLDASSELFVSMQRQNSNALPKALGVESLIGSVHSGSARNVNKSTTVAPVDDEDDFADFGAFESALPSVTSGTSTAPTKPEANSFSTTSTKPVKLLSGSYSGKSLNATIAGLYAQPRASTGPTASSTPFASSSVPVKRSPITTKSQKQLPLAPADMWGMESNQNFQRKDASPSFNLLHQKPLTPPPPPLPTLTDAKKDAPPPPSPTFPVDFANFTRSEGVGDSSATTEGNEISQGRLSAEPSLPTDVEHKQVEHAPVSEAPAQSDEDPFAFLAMQALSSVASKKKSGNDARGTNDTFDDTKSSINKKYGNISSASTGAKTAPSSTSDFSFEDLLG